MQINDVIREENGKFHVYSENGKHLGGPYDSQEEAKKRLKQVEFFKNQGDAVALNLTDTFILDNIHRSANGYLQAFAKAARTGIQLYKGKELGRPDLENVRVYRPPEEVFAPDAMRSFSNLPVTHTHPREPVRASNWKQYAVGYTGEDVVRDGEYIRVPLRIADQAAIDAYEKDGVRELSMGYSTDLKWGKGLTTDGQEYDAVQTALRGNHLALVPKARGGSDLRIGDDSKHGEKAMATKRVIVDGVPVEVEETVAGVIQNYCDQTAKKLTDAAASITQLTTQVSTKDAEIVTLKKQLEDSKITPEKIHAQVLDLSAVIEKSKAFVSDAYQFAGKSVEQIRKDVVAAKLGDAAKGWNDDQIKASFDTLTATAQTKDGDMKPLVNAINVNGSKSIHSAAQARDQAYADNVKWLQDAWKNPDRKAAN